MTKDHTDLGRDPIISGIPLNGGLTSLMDKHEAFFKNIFDATNALMRKEGFLERSDRELIAAYVSRVDECHFCEKYHTALACEIAGEDVEYILNKPNEKYRLFFWF